MKRIVSLTGAVLLLLTAIPQEAIGQSSNRPSPLLNYSRQGISADIPGDGYMVTGDLWDTVKPANTNEPARLNSRPYNGIQMVAFFHLGANDNEFFNPSGMWPNAYRIVNLFRNARKFGITAFDPDGWSGYAAGNRVFDLDAAKDSRFITAIYGPQVAGANDNTRNYQREAVYTDETRTHLVYEAGWPTTAGLDVKVRAHQYTGNEQNLNDFVVMEVTLTNTGVVDSNGDGTPEATDHRVPAVVFSMQGETAPSVKIGFGGDRTAGPDGASTFGAGRSFGYVGADDPEGNPYDIFAYFANVPPVSTQTVPPPGERDFGINNYANRDGHTDVWGAWRYMGVKQGSIEDAIGANGSVNAANLSSITSASPDKETLFGTHPIGVGPERGWYTSHTYQPGLVTYRWDDSAKEFRAGMATWFADYGRQADGSSRPTNLNPNPRFFASGTADDPTTWVPLGNPQRPHGDFKYASEDVSKQEGILQPVWESAWNPRLRGLAPGSASNADFFQAVGYIREWTFGESNKYGVGPFSLEVGESMTVAFVAAAGFRFEGIHDAIQAAEWAWDRGWLVHDDLPVPPAPEMQVQSTPAGTAIVNWTDVSNIDAEVDGYKIWRAAQYQRKRWLEEGMRLVDRAHHVHEVGASIDPFLDDINPFFDAEDTFEEPQGMYQPEEWGSYELLEKIPVSQLGEVASPGGAYDYAWEDTTSITGFTYWYYVSAYKEGSWTGPLGPVQAGHLESHHVVNRNGRNSPNAQMGTIGLESPWAGTYPFAWNHPSYPDVGTLAFKNFGAAFTVTPPVANVDDVANLITVSPNPYKITGLNDVRSNPASHNINFLNLPADFTLTIIDVSGQIIFQDAVEGAGDGRYVWDMFSKDGVEVSSGLYIYHLSYGNDQEHVGHFAILR